jgi:hypothetical protein
VSVLSSHPEDSLRDPRRCVRRGVMLRLSSAREFTGSGDDASTWIRMLASSSLPILRFCLSASVSRFFLEKKNGIKDREEEGRTEGGKHRHTHAHTQSSVKVFMLTPRAPSATAEVPPQPTRQTNP